MKPTYFNGLQRKFSLAEIIYEHDNDPHTIDFPRRVIWDNALRSQYLSFFDKQLSSTERMAEALSGGGVPPSQPILFPIPPTQPSVNRDTETERSAAEAAMDDAPEAPPLVPEATDVVRDGLRAEGLPVPDLPVPPPAPPPAPTPPVVFPFGLNTPEASPQIPKAPTFAPGAFTPQVFPMTPTAAPVSYGPGGTVTAVRKRDADIVWGGRNPLSNVVAVRPKAAPQPEPGPFMTRGWDYTDPQRTLFFMPNRPSPPPANTSFAAGMTSLPLPDQPEFRFRNRAEINERERVLGLTPIPVDPADAMEDDDVTMSNFTRARARQDEAPEQRRTRQRASSSAPLQALPAPAPNAAPRAEPKSRPARSRSTRPRGDGALAITSGAPRQQPASSSAAPPASTAPPRQRPASARPKAQPASSSSAAPPPRPRPKAQPASSSSRPAQPGTGRSRSRGAPSSSAPNADSIPEEAPRVRRPPPPRQERGDARQGGTELVEGKTEAWWSRQPLQFLADQLSKRDVRLTPLEQKGGWRTDPSGQRVRVKPWRKAEYLRAILETGRL